jgi:hypothetical protein
MGKATYTERRTLLRYDDSHVLVYLNEEIIDGYVPESATTEATDEAETPQPVTGYSYTGSMPDGGTLIEATSTDRDTLINGIIRSRYSQTEEDALKTHQLMLLTEELGEERKTAYRDEWKEFCDFRLGAIALVDGWLQAEAE